MLAAFACFQKRTGSGRLLLPSVRDPIRTFTDRVLLPITYHYYPLGPSTWLNNIKLDIRSFPAYPLTVPINFTRDCQCCQLRFNNSKRSIVIVDITETFEPGEYRGRSRSTDERRVRVEPDHGVEEPVRGKSLFKLQADDESR